MYTKFRTQFDKASDDNLVVIELSTLGGDPEVARMMGEDVRFASEMEPQRRLFFLGKAAIYSAGTTFLSFFARQNRYLARGTRLMIHERKLSKELVIDGPLSTCIAVWEGSQGGVCQARKRNARPGQAAKDEVSLFERYAKGGDNGDLKAWAGKTLPALQHHLDMAERLSK